MKSSNEDLKKRGYIENITINYDLNEEEINELLESSDAYNRSIAVRILSNNNKNNINMTKKILEKLSKEKALYTKIEMCNYLEKGNLETVKLMIDYLGLIGKNQYKEIPFSPSKKISYPLPRDIIARTLGRMGKNNLNILFEVLEKKDINKIREVIDSIGFMIFYNNELDTLDNFNNIKNIIEKYQFDKITLWKSITCLSAFKRQESINLLLKIKETEKNDTILLEIDRSLKIIKNIVK